MRPESRAGSDGTKKKIKFAISVMSTSIYTHT